LFTPWNVVDPNPATGLSWLDLSLPKVLNIISYHG
jgi:hypothetical protein